MFERTTALWRRLTDWSPGACPDQHEDRRGHVRYAHEMPTTIVPAAASGDPRVPARIRDISQGGVSLLTGVALEPGSMLTVGLPRGEGQSAVEALACVIYTKEAGPRQWVLGCDFARELDIEDLSAFGVPVPPEARAWKRYPCHVSAAFVPALEEGATPVPARAANVSLTGVALVADRDVPPGTMLSVDLRRADGTQTLSILACVVHVHVRPDGQQVIGCNFIRELSEADLKSLV